MVLLSYHYSCYIREVGLLERRIRHRCYSRQHRTNSFRLEDARRRSNIIFHLVHSAVRITLRPNISKWHSSMAIKRVSSSSLRGGTDSKRPDINRVLCTVFAEVSREAYFIARCPGTVLLNTGNKKSKTKYPANGTRCSPLSHSYFQFSYGRITSEPSSQHTEITVRSEETRGIGKAMLYHSFLLSFSWHRPGFCCAT